MENASENRKAVLITAPVIRRDLSHMLRQHVPSLDVLYLLNCQIVKK